MTSRTLLSAALASLALFACAPDPKVVAERTATDVQSLVREAWVTAEGSNQWSTLDSSLLALGVSAEARATSMRVPAVSSLDTSLDAVKQRIGAIFAESNIVDRSGGALTFQVRGVDVCTSDSGALDASCADSVDELHLLVRASGDLDLALLVGTEKAELFSLEVRKGVSLAVVVDLARSLAAVAAIQSAQGSPVSSTTYDAKGKVEWRLTRHGANDFTLSSAVLAPVTYSMTVDGVLRTATIGVKNPLASLHVEGPAKRATVQFGYGEVKYTGLLRDLFTTETASSRPLEAFLSGAGFTLVFEEGKTARLENLGLGGATSTLKSGSDTLLSVDFNKDHGRAVGATWAPTAAGFALTFTPGLQAEAHFGLGAIESATLTVDPSQRNSTWSASFLGQGGKAPSVEFFTQRGTAADAPFARLVEGELHLSIDEPAASRSFSAPSCLTSSSGETSSTWVERFASTACP